jgi:hypothetical protein
MMEAITCVVDWPGTMSFIKDFIVSCAAMFTAWVAYKGISKWRNEESGKVDFDLARRLGKTVYRMRDLLSNARRPFIMNYEFPAGYNSNDKERQAEAYSHLFTQRFSPVRDCAIEIQSLRNEVEALWGTEIVIKLDELLTRVRYLQTAMTAFVSDKQDYGSHFKSDKAFGDSVRARVFDDGNALNLDGTEGEPNAFTTEIGKIVDEIAAYVRSRLPTS